MGELLEHILVLQITQAEQANWQCCPFPWDNSHKNRGSSGCWKSDPNIFHCTSLCCTPLLSRIFPSLRDTFCHPLTTHHLNISCQPVLPWWARLHFCYRPLCPRDAVSITPGLLNLHHRAINGTVHPSPRVCSLDHTFLAGGPICSSS